MPLILTTTDRKTGQPVYLAEGEAGVIVRTPYPVNATMWADLSDLNAWLATRPPEQRDRLAAPDVAIEEIEIDWRGVTAAELAASADANATCPLTRTVRKRKENVGR